VPKDKLITSKGHFNNHCKQNCSKRRAI